MQIFCNIISSRAEVFDQLNCPVEHNLKCRIPEKLPSVAKKRLLRKQIKRHYLSSAQKLASNRTFESAFLERIRKVQKLSYESNLLKIVDCFIDGYVSLSRERVNFCIKN